MTGRKRLRDNRIKEWETSMSMSLWSLRRGASEGLRNLEVLEVMERGQELLVNEKFEAFLSKREPLQP